MKVLVLCTGNSARSQMAEGLLRARGVQAFSAGTNPKEVNPFAIRVMKEIGIDISGQVSKDVSTFQEKRFDWVITVCDRAKEACPIFPGARTLHWSTQDPVTLEDFRNARDRLAVRIEEFLTGSTGRIS